MISEVLLLIGSAFALIGAIGMLRFPDVYTRLHANTVCTVGGTVSILLALAYKGPLLSASKFIIIILFIALTSPTGSHIIANAAYHAGVKARVETLNFGEKIEEEK